MGKADKYLQLENELKSYVAACGKAADIIIEQDVSNYPIFVVSQQEIAMGISLINKEEQGGQWNINASTLEEFVAKSIIYNEKVDEFRDNFKSVDEYICMFVLSELGANFIYLSRK